MDTPQRLGVSRIAAQQSTAADCLQPTLRSRWRARLNASVRCLFLMRAAFYRWWAW